MSTLSINDIKTKSTPICKNYDVAQAYLFGSYARGEATEDSDVDIRNDVFMNDLGGRSTLNKE